jgi:chromosome partitioning protein
LTARGHQNKNRSVRRLATWVDAESRDSRRKALAAHVIVLGNEKGGSGKSTTAMHLAIALLKAGQRVATIDLDSRQGTLTHYVERRCRWAT